MSDLILLLKSLSKQGLDEYISKQQKEESFPKYILNNINTTRQKMTAKKDKKNHGVGFRNNQSA